MTTRNAGAANAYCSDNSARLFVVRPIRSSIRGVVGLTGVMRRKKILARNRRLG